MHRRRTTATRQLSFTWGGAREGAGRPARGPIASERHTTRPVLVPWFPVHVIARVDRSIRALGRRDAYATIRRAVTLSLARSDFRIVRLAIRAQRLELLVEADDKRALARGMQGFQVSAARAVNRAMRRTGNVFPDRYRMTILRTRAEARDAVRAALRPDATRTRAVRPVLWVGASAAPMFLAPAYPETAILLACVGSSPRAP